MKTYTSDLTSIPDWLGAYGDQTGKSSPADFGFGPDGMYFIGSAGDFDPVTAYSVRTNFNISGHQVCEVIFTVDHNDICTDQGICFYNDGQSPNWHWDPDNSRIAFSINCPVPHIYGTNKHVNNSGEYYGTYDQVCSGPGECPEGGTPVLGDDLYTFKVTYNPAARTVSAITYEGSDTSGTIVDTLVLHEKLLNGGPYRIGFDADNDEGGTAYFKSLTINVYESNGVSDDADLNNKLNNLKQGYSQVTDLVDNLFLFSDDADTYDTSADATDPNFNQLGLGDVVFIQSDGKIIVGGQSGLNDYSRNLRRINEDGTEDESFMPPVFTGGCCDEGYVRDVAQQSDGKLIVVGHFEQVSQFENETEVGHIVRLAADGTLDEFNCVPGADGQIHVVKVLSDDRILIGGYFNTYDGINCSNIALLNSDGIVDETFAGNVSLSAAVHEIEVTGDYSGGTLGIYVGGQFSNKIIKLNEDGTTDVSFYVGSGFGSSIGGNNPRVSSIKVQNDGKVLVGHWFSTYDGADCGKGLTRLNSDGSLDDTFYSELFDDDWSGTHSDDDDHRGGVNAIALQDNGKIIAGGWFDNANGTWKNKIVRINTNGSADNAFDVGFGFSWAGYNWSPRIQDVKLDSDGNVYVAGSFTDYNHAARFQYAKLDTNGSLQEWSALPPFRQWGIDDGMEDIYDSGSFFNTNLTQPYLDVLDSEDNVIINGIKCIGGGGEGVCELVGHKSIPSTHTQAWNQNPEQDFYDESADPNTEDGVDWMRYRYLPVSDGHVMIGDGYFGEGSSYFTTMLPGIFILAAHNININEFSITGNLGTDGSATDAVSVYPISVGGSDYTVYLKSNYGGNDPSVNQIIIVDGNNGGVTQYYDDTSEQDDHAIVGLSGKTKLYYICISKACTNEDNCGQEMTASEAQSIATKFLEILGGNCTVKTYEVDLSPDNPETIPNYQYDGEGNMDTAIIVDPITGKRRSIQRTGYFELADNCGNRKIISAKDGETFDSNTNTWVDAVSSFVNANSTVSYSKPALKSTPKPTPTPN